MPSHSQVICRFAAPQGEPPCIRTHLLLTQKAGYPQLLRRFTPTESNGVARAGGGADLLVGGWELIGIDALQTGVPVLITRYSSAANSQEQAGRDVCLHVPPKLAHSGLSEWHCLAHFLEGAPGHPWPCRTPYPGNINYGRSARAKAVLLI